MARNIRFVALVLLLLLPCLAPAEVHIPLDCRIPNRPPGRCGWCALETVARHQHIRRLYGLRDGHNCRCDPGDLEAVLREQKVTYCLQRAGTRDTAILTKSLAAGHGVVVGFRELQPGAGGHIVTLVELSEREAHVIDSNDQDRRVRVMGRDRFLFWWDGFALAVEETGPSEEVRESAHEKEAVTPR